jgi:hypothetical protein
MKEKEFLRKPLIHTLVIIILTALLSAAADMFILHQTKTSHTDMNVSENSIPLRILMKINRICPGKRILIFQT